MKTVAQLKALVARAGGTLEEDEAGSMSDMRLFQICAPADKVWTGSDTIHLVAWWARGASAQAVRFNEDAFKDAAQRVKFGLRDMTPEEQELCADD